MATVATWGAPISLAHDMAVTRKMVLGVVAALIRLRR